MALINKKLLKYIIFSGKGSPHACYFLYTQTVKLAFPHFNLEAEGVSPYQKIEILEDLSNTNSKFSNTSAGIVFFAKAQGKQSSMHGYRPKSGPRTSSHSGKRGTTHHGGLICLQTDRNFANHTTEMILWSIILTVHHQSFPNHKSEIRQQIGEQKHGIIRQISRGSQYL